MAHRGGLARIVALVVGLFAAAGAVVLGWLARQPARSRAATPAGPVPDEVDPPDQPPSADTIPSSSQLR